MKHDPEKCPYCVANLTLQAGLDSPSRYDVILLHLMAKVQELEARIQQQEWHDAPIGPGPDGNYGQDDLEEQRLDVIRKVLGKREPECAICFDEEGSYACLRMAHEARKKRNAE